MKGLLTTLVASAAIAAASGAGAQQCADNFKQTGSFLSGQTLTTRFDLEGVSPADAFARIERFTSQNGYTIRSSNLQSGVISATDSRVTASGRQVPLSIAIEPTSKGSSVAMTMTTAVGQFVSDANLRAHFCATQQAAASGAGADPSAAPRSALATAAAQPVAVQMIGGIERGAPYGMSLPLPRTKELVPDFAIPTLEQRVKVVEAIDRIDGPPDLREMLQQAKPMLAEFIERQACWANSFSGKDHFTAFGPDGMNKKFQEINWNQGRPMPRARYHDPHACLTVTGLSELKVLARNTFSFKTNYDSSVSGEKTSTEHRSTRSAEGVWSMVY